MNEEYNMIERNNLTTATTEPVELKMVMTRFFNASPELVFKTYIDPSLIPRWWGPKRLTTYVIKMDVRPRGIWGSSSETQTAMSTSSMACIMRLWRLRGLYTPLNLKECLDT